MGSYPTNRFVPHTRKRECDRCGFDYLLVELIKEERTGYLVCLSCYDPPHLLDIRGTGARSQAVTTTPAGTGKGIELEGGGVLIGEDGQPIETEG